MNALIKIVILALLIVPIHASSQSISQLSDSDTAVIRAFDLFESNGAASAINYLETVIAEANGSQGSNAPVVGELLFALGQIQALTGQLDAAERSMRQALSIRNESYGASDPRVREAADDLAIVWEQQGRTVEASQLRLDPGIALRPTMPPSMTDQILVPGHKPVPDIFVKNNETQPPIYIEPAEPIHVEPVKPTLNVGQRESPEAFNYMAPPAPSSLSLPICSLPDPLAEMPTVPKFYRCHEKSTADVAIENCILSVDKKLNSFINELVNWAEATDPKTTLKPTIKLGKELYGIAKDLKGHAVSCLKETAWQQAPIPSALKNLIDSASEFKDKATTKPKLARGYAGVEKAIEEAKSSGSGLLASWTGALQWLGGEWKGDERLSGEALASAQQSHNQCDLVMAHQQLEDAIARGRKALYLARVERDRLLICEKDLFNEIEIRKHVQTEINRKNQKGPATTWGTTIMGTLKRHEGYKNGREQADREVESLEAHLAAVGSLCTDLERTRKRVLDMEKMRRKLQQSVLDNVKTCNIEQAKQALESLRRLEGHPCLKLFQTADKLAQELEPANCPEEKPIQGGLRLVDDIHGGHPSPYVDDRNRVFGTMTYTMSDGSSTFKVNGSQQYKEGSWSVNHTWQAPSVLPPEGETVTIKVSASANVKLPGHSVTLRPGAGLSGSNCSIYAGKTGNGTEVPGRTVDCNFVVRKNVSEASFVVVNGPHSHTYKYARQ